MSHVISPDNLSFEEQLFPLFEHATLGLAKVGLDCRWLRVNQRLCEMTGYTEAELLAQTFCDITHPDDLEADLTNMKAVLAGALPVNVMEKRYICKDGSILWIHLTATLVKDTQGAPDYFIVVIEDISRRKEMEKTLLESRERYELVLSGSNDGIWDWDLRQNSTYWNDRFYEILGLSRESSPPNVEAGWDLIHPDDLERVNATIQAHIKRGEKYDLEFRMRHSSGAYRYVHARAQAILDESGQPVRMAGVITDITDRVLAEQAVLESEERFRSLAEQAPIMIWMTDASGGNIFSNKAWLEFVGHTREDNLGDGWVKPVHPDDRQTEYLKFQEAYQNRAAYKSNFRLKRKDGEYRWVAASGSPRFTPSGEFAGYLGICQDITDRTSAEEALQQSEARFRRVADSDIIGIVFWNKEPGGITDANEAFLQMVGYTREEMLSGAINWRDMTPPEYLPVDEAAFRQMDSHPKGKCEPYEKQYIAKDGRRIDILLAVAYYEGRKDSGVAFILDITERKQAERALKESEERFRELADISPFMVWMTGPDGQVNYHSKRTLEFTGLTLEQTLQQNWLERVHPEDRESFVRKFVQCFEQRAPYEDELRACRVDGEYRWLLSMGVPRFDANSQFLGYIGSTIDITERKHAEMARQASLEKEQLLRRIMEIVSRSLILDNVLDDIVAEVGRYFNADRCGLLRYSLEDSELRVELSKQYSPEFPPLQDDEIPFKSLGFLKQHLLQHQEPDIINISNMEELAREGGDYFEKYNLDAEHYNAEMEALFRKYSVKSNLAVEIYYQGLPYGMIGLHQCRYSRVWTSEEVSLLRDIATHVGVAFSQSELFQQEQKARSELEVYTRKLETSNRELEQFATIASHDLQEPLRKVQMFSQMLAEYSTQEGRDYIERIQNATTRMQNLISDLLALSRISRKGQPFRKTSLNRCVENALGDLEIAIRELQPDIMVEPLVEIDADEKQIEQLFMNLIGNALKFHKPGEKPKVHISGRILADNQYELVVEDNGIGFEEQYRERVFQPFERLHGRSAQYPGTGMGLCIVHKIVERHQGSVTANSQPGIGSTFIVTLPLRQC